VQEGLDHGSRAGSEPHHNWAPGQQGALGPSGADPPAPSLQALMQTNPDILKTIQVNEPQGGTPQNTFACLTHRTCKGHLMVCVICTQGADHSTCMVPELQLALCPAFACSSPWTPFWAHRSTQNSNKSWTASYRHHKAASSVSRTLALTEPVRL